MIAIGGEKYEDMLEYRLKQLEKSRKPAREASSFYIVWSNIDRKETRYSSFDSIPIDVKNDEINYEIMKIRYERQERRTQKTGMFAPTIVERSGYSYYEKLLHILLIKRDYKENKDFVHLFRFESQPYVLDFAFVKEKLDIECDGEPWHEKCRNREEDRLRDEYLRKKGWKILRFKFKSGTIKDTLINAIKQIDLEIKKMRKS